MAAVAAQLEKFKAAFAREDLEACVKLLAELKMGMLSFGSLPPAAPSAPSSSQQQELLLAREILEYGTLVSIKTVDIPAFERHIAQVRRWPGRRAAPQPSPSRPRLGRWGGGLRPPHPGSARARDRRPTPARPRRSSRCTMRTAARCRRQSGSTRSSG